MVLLPTSENSAWNALTQSKSKTFIDFTLYQEQVSFANDVCPLLLDLNLLVTFLCVAVATKQERILLNQVKTKKTPQGKVLKRNNIINEQRIYYL